MSSESKKSSCSENMMLFDRIRELENQVMVLTRQHEKDMRTIKAVTKSYTELLEAFESRYLKRKLAESNKSVEMPLSKLEEEQTKENDINIKGDKEEKVESLSMTLPQSESRDIESMSRERDLPPRSYAKEAARRSSSSIEKKKKDRTAFKCIEVVRNKEERSCLPGHVCIECDRYYAELERQGILLDAASRAEMLQRCSRHKAKWEPPATPEGYWDLSVHTPAAWK